MPARHFDGQKLKAARAAASFSQADLAGALDVSRKTVSAWEQGRGRPDPQRLPAIARAFDVPIDRLFERRGEPDLADLRCDAGFAQYEVENQLGARDAVMKAERGLRRLPGALVAKLIDLYAVTEDELRAAEDQAFGMTCEVDTAASTSQMFPTTIAEKIDYLLELTFPDAGRRPSDTDIARSINEAAGAVVMSEVKVQELRRGTATETTPVIRQGLAQVFGVDEFFFRANDKMPDAIASGLRTLGLVRTGQISQIAARGMGGQSLSAEVLQALIALVDSAAAPAAGRGRDRS
ncbi:helix-turn-helix transcriptional regulator [Streptomyces aureocirculatus]|uniref:helix-turn-helix transcriptional regulator n=1 Tax=Streptomyces aureocirculatus TaxID=67275 RepID=UPI00068965E2|nr:helix-turn-helix transcriptional regulator [Streptomyces aureocirculatus]